MISCTFIMYFYRLNFHYYFVTLRNLWVNCNLLCYILPKLYPCCPLLHISNETLQWWPFSSSMHMPFFLYKAQQLQRCAMSLVPSLGWQYSPLLHALNPILISNSSKIGSAWLIYLFNKCFSLVRLNQQRKSEPNRINHSELFWTVNWTK